MFAKKFRISIYNLGKEYAVESSVLERIEKSEFKKWFKACREMFMDLVEDRPYTFRIVFRSYGEALSMAAELARRIGEECIYDGEKKGIVYVPQRCQLQIEGKV
jgi:hypothetical protein